MRRIIKTFRNSCYCPFCNHLNIFIQKDNADADCVHVESAKVDASNNMTTTYIFNSKNAEVKDE